MSSCPHDEHVISSISPRRTRGHQADEHVINSISPTRTRRAAMARAAAAFLGALACLLRIETMAWVCGARQKIGIVNGCGTERLHVYVGESRSLVRNALAVAQRFRVLGLGIHLVGDGRSTSCAGSWQSTRVGGTGPFSFPERCSLSLRPPRCVSTGPVVARLAGMANERERKEVHTAITAPNLLVPRASAVLPETTHGGHRTQL